MNLLFLGKRMEVRKIDVFDDDMRFYNQSIEPPGGKRHRISKF
jgi:hypothetical protein